MRHSKAKLQLNRFTSWRKATLKSLASSIILHESIKTTLTKAKAVKPLVDELITLAKLNTLFARRRAYQLLGQHRLVSILFSDIGPRYTNRAGGYTRILSLGSRRGDSAEIAILELTEIKKKKARKPKKAKEGEKDTGKETVSDVTPEKQPPAEQKPAKEVAVKERPPITKKPSKKFLGGLRNIFKKERDSL